MRTKLFLLVLLLSHPASADELLRALDSLCLPSGYNCEAESRIDGTEVVSGVRRARVAVTQHWVWVERAEDIEGVGRTIVDVRMGANGETWALNPSIFRITRTDDFGQRHIIAGETDYSPVGVVRALRGLSREGLEFSTNPQTGVTTYRVIVTHHGYSAPVEVDIHNGRILAYRASFVSGRFHSQTTYEDWVELPEGGCVPTRVVSQSFDRSPTEPAVRRTVRVSDARLIAAASAPPPFPRPNGYVIVDEIEGVTKRSDGTVIAPIEYPAEQPSRHGTGLSRPSLNTALLVSGVALVILAGVVWRARSRGGS